MSWLTQAEPPHHHAPQPAVTRDFESRITEKNTTDEAQISGNEQAIQWVFSLNKCFFSVGCMQENNYENTDPHDYLARQLPGMRYMKWIGFGAAVLLIVSCFTPWIFIESKNITISGIASAGTNFGKPGYFHFFLTALFLVCTFTPRIWAKRLNLLVCALNLAWAVRNFFVLAACSGGECPVRKTGIWCVLIAAVLMLLSALFPDMPAEKRKSQV